MNRVVTESLSAGEKEVGDEAEDELEEEGDIDKDEEEAVDAEDDAEENKAAEEAEGEGDSSARCFRARKAAGEAAASCVFGEDKTCEKYEDNMTLDTVEREISMSGRGGRSRTSADMKRRSGGQKFNRVEAGEGL